MYVNFITASSLIATISTVIGACLFAASVSPNIRGTNTMFIMMMIGRFFTGAACGSSRSKYGKTCVKRPLSKRSKIVFKTNYRLMQVKSIAECSKGSIQQYFRPSLSYHLSLKSSFSLFLRGRFTQVLL